MTAKALKRKVALAMCGLALAACATPSANRPQPRPPTPPTAPVPQAEGPTFTLQPARYDDLPGFSTADLGPALAALRRSCGAIARAADDRPLGRLAPYGGTVGQWRNVCAAAATATDARTFFQTQFTPYQVAERPDQMRRLTGYYEPVLEARRTPDATFTEPFLGRPSDLVGIDLSQFDEATDLSENLAEEVMRAAGQGLSAAEQARVQTSLDERLERRFQTPLWGRLTQDRRVVPYAPRAELDRSAGVLGYARACDVYDAQVQGSARVRFDDGQQMRVAYAAQNGWRWQSIYPQLRDRGAAGASKTAVCGFLAGRSAQEAAGYLALDPSYVFFTLEPIADPTAGPRGAQGVPLTPLGSMAVDPGAHPYGAVLFVASDDASVQRLVVAQDTGGAIRRGPLRGDLYFGTGADAGAQAERTNTPVRFWTLLPHDVTPNGGALISATQSQPSG